MPKIANPVELGHFRLVINKWIKPSMNNNNFEDQFAFVPMPGRGCTNALTLIYGAILHHQETDSHSQIMAVDFSKAFD